MKELKATIIRVENGVDRYFDKNGTELFEGDYIKAPYGIKKLYRTAKDELGTDATNPSRIKMGISVKCEAGIYPLEFHEMKDIEKAF